MSQSVKEGMNDSLELLGPWFHNLHLPDGRETAPDHFLGDFPREKWLSFQHVIPENLAGWSVIDIGCNGGFYSFELAKRGAQVTAIDYDARYLEQAKWAAEQLGLGASVTFEQKQVYDLAADPSKYDLVWFMGVLYHLRYPLLGLDIVARKTNKLLVLQTMTMPGEEALETPPDMGLTQRHLMQDAGWPKMAFIEHRLEGDPTNWWAANHACVEAMIRAAGLEVIERPAHEIYLCRPSLSPRSHDDLLIAEYLSATQQRR
jgi:tRNA (mo5U34)-methyltransferase